MKKFLILAAVFFLLHAGAARAQIDPTEKPAATKPLHIAMLYQKLTRQKPDFENWVEHTPDFQNAALNERADILQRKTKELETAYHLLTPMEPVVLEIPVRISSYSQQQRGFLITSFSDMTFFGYEYAGNNYAVIPNKIAEYQWLKSPPDLAPAIMRETDNGQNAKIVMTLSPLSAHAEPLAINGRNYRLVMTDIYKMEIWSKDGTKIVWDTQMNHPGSRENKLLNLYQ